MQLLQVRFFRILPRGHLSPSHLISFWSSFSLLLLLHSQSADGTLTIELMAEVAVCSRVHRRSDIGKTMRQGTEEALRVELMAVVAVYRRVGGQNILG